VLFQQLMERLSIAPKVIIIQEFHLHKTMDVAIFHFIIYAGMQQQEVCAMNDVKIIL
jgi:hypothetical protein